AACDNPTARGGRPTRTGEDPGASTTDRPRVPVQRNPSQMTVETSTWATKKGLAQMLKCGVIMDVDTPDQAKVAEDAGAVAVMALERVPADIRKAGGVARMSDPEMIVGIMDAVTIPVMAKARIGHFVEAQVLEALGVDHIDESEVLPPADEVNHIDKHAFKVPFVRGCRNLGEALRRINEGAAMIRTKGEAGTGNVVEAVRQLRDVLKEIRKLQGMREDELFVAAKELQAPYELVRQVAQDGKLPVVNFVAGGISTPSDAALVMQLGSEGVFVGSGMIVLSNQIVGGEEPVLPLLDVAVERNAFGRQLDSFEADLAVPILGDRPVHAVFIRAPVIESVGPDVDVLARLDDGRIVAVRE